MRTTYRTVEVNGIEIFYREAGPADAPTILLLHGFPSSSRMWEPLLTRLADAFHLVAPDYPGFGHSDTPNPAAFAYTFDHLAEVIDGFTEKLGLTRYVLFLQDYGGPIGFRLARAHPDRVQALIVQNAVAHEDGLGPLWETRRQFWAHRPEHETALRENFLSAAATRLRHVGTSPTPENYDPDLWADELAFLRRPGQADIQTDLFFDYQTNVASYPAWQEWLRGRQPPLLVTWGRYDPSFEAAEAAAYKRDVPDAEVHLLEGGHFALEEQASQIADLTRKFLATKLATPRAAMFQKRIDFLRSGMTEERFSSDQCQNIPGRPGEESQLPRAEPADEGAAAVVGVFYEALLAEDAPRALGVLAPDVAWYEMPGGPYAQPDGRPYQGAAEIAEGVLSRQIGDVEDLAMERHEMLVYGDSIIVLGTATGKGRKTGVRLEIPFAHVWVTRDHQIVEFRQYIDPVRFLAAVDPSSA